MGEGLLGVVDAEERGGGRDEGGEKRGDVGCWGAEEGVESVYDYDMALVFLLVVRGRGEGVGVGWNGRTCCGAGAGYFLEFVREFGGVEGVGENEMVDSSWWSQCFE